MTTLEPVSWTYAYLSLSAALSLVWVALYVLRHDLNASMLRVSLYTGLLGLTEPLFVPRYWNPFTLLDLARRTGFDLESFLFAFSIGGIAFAAYELLFHVGPLESITAERDKGLHRQHTVALLSAPLVFAILSVMTHLNPIYVSAIALIAGFFATLVLSSRPMGEDDRQRWPFLYDLLFSVRLNQPCFSEIRRSGVEPESNLRNSLDWRTTGRVDVRFHLRSVLVERLRALHMARLARWGQISNTSNNR